VSQQNRGVSPVVGTILLVAVVVILAAVLGAFAFGFGSTANDVAPFVAESSGEFQSDVAGGGDQIVTLTHEGGDSVDVSLIQIRVSFSEHEEVGRLVNLPAEGDDPQPTDEYVRGDDVFDNSANSVSGSIGTEPPDTDGQWSVGDTIQFRIASGAVSVSSGETVVVEIIHSPSDSIIVSKSIIANK
jgi:flagellin-like protein